MRTNIYEMCDFEVASDVPEILGQLFDGISRAMFDVLFAKRPDGDIRSPIIAN